MSRSPRKAPKVSVVIPAYNVDRFVARAIESVQNQTLADIEVLVVDDGSSDRTGQIADRIAERDIRVDVFHTPNQGAPAARNLALDKARGEYVFFMDADDWAEPQMLSEMYELARESDLQVVVAGFYIETYYSADSFTTEYKGCPSRLFATQQEFRSAAWQLFDQNLFYPPWNKLYSRAYLEEKGIRFKPTFWDDFPFVLDFIRDVERVGVTDRAYYHFIRAREESETSRWRKGMYEKREEEHGWMLDLYRHWGLDGDPASMEMIQRRYIERLIGCIENVCEPECTLPPAEKKALIRRMITSDRAQLAVRIAEPNSRMMRLMLGPIRSCDEGRAYVEGCVISYVKRHNTKLFATLKANR